MAAKKIVHIVGTGTIGEPLIGLFGTLKEAFGVDEVTFHKRTPLKHERAKVESLVRKGAKLAVDESTRAEFERLDSAEETQFVPGSSGYAAYGPDQVVSWPYYGLAATPGIDPEVVNASPVVTYDTIPLGEVEVRRGDAVHATDGDIGRVQGLVIDPRSHHVTHVLLQEGHLWGRKEVAIPISAVTRVDDGIWLSITKQDVAGLPPVDIDHPAG